MQSNFKGTPPPFILEIQNDLRVAVEAAEHIILFGYSLPPDDVTYRAFFSARQARQQMSDGKKVRCSVVVGTGYEDRWYEKDEIAPLLEEMKKQKPCESPATTLQAACDLFGADSVRYYGAGIPNVFCDGDVVSREKFDRLINWNH